MALILGYLDNLEIAVCLRINRYGRPRSVRRFFAVVSRLGDGPYWWLIGCGCVLLRRQQALPFLARTAAAAAAGLLIYKMLKRRLTRERPYVANDGILCGTPPLDRYSFPSGHTLHAVVFTTMFASFEPLLLLVTAPFALLVAASRIVLGLHYPSDVIAGAVIGALVATIGLSI